MTAALVGIVPSQALPSPGTPPAAPPCPEATAPPQQKQPLVPGQGPLGGSRRRLRELSACRNHTGPPEAPELPVRGWGNGFGARPGRGQIPVVWVWGILQKSFFQGRGLPFPRDAVPGSAGFCRKAKVTRRRPPRPTQGTGAGARGGGVSREITLPAHQSQKETKLGETGLGTELGDALGACRKGPVMGVVGWMGVGLGRGGAEMGMGELGG